VSHPYTAVLAASLCALTALSAFFSASETAFTALSRIRIKNLAAQGNKKAVLTLRLLDNYDKLLSTILIGNNIVNISSSALATVLFIGFFGPGGVGLATLFETVVIIVVGELTPKTLAKEAPERIAFFCAPLLDFFVRACTPLNFLAVHWKGFVTRLFRVKGGRAITEAELLTFVEEARQDGGINEREERLIKKTIDFDDLIAREICTPRFDVCAVSADAGAQAVDEVFRATRYSRLPVYKGTIDNITGILLYKDFAYEVLRGGKTPAQAAKDALFVPPSMKAPRLLRLLQDKRSQMAVLVDEYGGTMGIVTLEDLLEELVGEIWDEHDEVVKNIRSLGGGRFAVQGRVRLEELREFFALPEAVENTTLGNWVMERSEETPRLGDEFDLQGLRVTLTRIHHHRLLEAVVTPSAAA